MSITKLPISMIDPEPMTKILDTNYTIGIKRLGVGGGAGTWSNINADGSIIGVSPTYFNNHPVYSGITDVTIDGQYMVKVPKFYVKNVNHTEIYISPTRVDSSFHVHPAFMLNNSEVDQFYVGKYQSSVASSKTKSIPNVSPSVSINWTNYKSYCNKRNVNGVSGFMMWSVYQWSAIQILALIEKQTTDMQAVIGRGRVDTSSAGSVSASDVAQATYRGIVGLWGNIWQWIDGLDVATGIYRLWDNKGNKTWQTTKSTAYTGTWSYCLSPAIEYGTNYDTKDVFLTVANQTTTTYNEGTYSDGTHGTNGESATTACLVGGIWGDSSYCGLFCAYVGTAVSDSAGHIASRLAKY